jgi:hypothetical protein
MSTQWKIAAGMGGAIRTGLDYTALEPVARSVGIPVPISPRCFADFRQMEAAALKIYAQKARG